MRGELLGILSIVGSTTLSRLFPVRSSVVVSQDSRVKVLSLGTMSLALNISSLRLTMRRILGGRVYIHPSDLRARSSIHG